MYFLRVSWAAKFQILTTYRYFNFTHFQIPLCPHPLTRQKKSNLTYYYFVFNLKLSAVSTYFFFHFFHEGWTNVQFIAKCLVLNTIFNRLCYILCVYFLALVSESRRLRLNSQSIKLCYIFTVMNKIYTVIVDFYTRLENFYISR